jgi:hypothetical protein
MTNQIDALKQALGALEYHTEQTRPIWKTEQAITAIKQALAAPVQEPEIVQRVKRYAGKTMRTARNPNITARECIELANWIVATPPAAPVQDLPFGVGGGLVAIKTLLSRDPCVHANTAVEMIDAILKEHPAAQRQWVGLTDAEMQDLWDRYAHMEMMRAIEAKLKERNQ